MIYLKNISSFESVLDYECLDCQFTRVCIDTREYTEGDLFVAISGEKFNAFSFIESIVKKGCDCIVFTQNQQNEDLLAKYKKNFPRVKFMRVTDSIRFLQELAKDHVFRLKTIKPELCLISISGSNGKTTCKEMLRYLLSQLSISTVATAKNDNNHLGVPLTLLKITEQTQAAIIELGSNHPGEIETLYNLFIPDHVYVTNIGMTHMEFFPTLEDVFEEEAYPLKNIKDQQTGWINVDDKFLRSLSDSRKISLKNIGVESDDFQTSNDSIHIWGQLVKNKELLGSYNYHNLGVMLSIAACVVGDSLQSDLLEAAKSYSPGLMRSQWLEINGVRIFLDAYNANPSSMKLALEGFFHFVKSKKENFEDVKIIIGDMLELGPQAAALHREIGRILGEYNKIEYIFIGDFAQDYERGLVEAASSALRVQIYPNLDEFLASRDVFLNNCKYLFLKASRSLQLERILDNI